jgi:AraC family transcriptional regulator, regulatory protein of adaptative response / methylphosphotriester-DNA alkyltransferase methyltransferase
MRPSTIDQRRRLYLQARVVVARHYRRPLTLDGVAHALASSPRQLTRVYAQFGEVTFREDLLTRRLGVAAQLLIEQPAISVRDVARLVGFSQAPHFARAFRRRYGLTPARFRAEGRAYARGAVSSLGSDSTAVAPGRRRRISVPPPGADSALTLPPCCSATWRTIARPSPEPERPRASAPR